uniref:Centriolar coiled-coil protein of 110 kDa-like n=1 Tax=Esox lucius TaxID=8010 RepID=A0AAY5KZN6_ESOLU
MPHELTVQKSREMAQYRQRAVQLEMERLTQNRSGLLARVQNILDNAQKLPEMELKMEPQTPPYCCSPPPAVSGKETVNGYTLVADSHGVLSGGELVGLRIAGRPRTPPTDPPVLLNGHSAEERETPVEKIEREKTEEEEAGKGQEVNLQTLLRRSREYVEREQAQRCSKVIGRVTPSTPPAENFSDKENERRVPHTETSPDLGCRLRHNPPSPTEPLYQECDPYDSRFSLLSPCPPDTFPLIPSPEPSQSPRPHRRRPRPVSTGNISMSFPIGPSDLIPRGLAGRHQEASAATATGGGSPYQGPGSGSGLQEVFHDGQFSRSPVREKSPVSASGPAPLGHHDIMATGFRRRCYTLDSQLHPSPSDSRPAVDRSRERLPRFIGGVPHLTPSRRSTAVQPNQPFDTNSPSPAPLRTHVRPLTPDLSPCHQPQGPHEGRVPVVSNCLELLDSKTEEAQRRVRALEDMQRRLEEEHALQMSLLMAEQEREQQRLRQELDEKERRLRELGRGRPLSGGSGRDRSDSYPSCPDLSPALSPDDRSPGHSGQDMGIPTPLNSSAPYDSMQSPIYLRGHTWGASKPRGRFSQVVTVEQQRALCRLGAIVHGFLTRRLLQTEKVKHLRQTVQDTQEFIRSFQRETPQKKGAISAQDLSLQERVRAQLRAARYDIHDIFFEMPLEERLALLKLDREVRTEKKLREMEKARTPKDRVLSTATQRSLDRKKRVGESPGQVRKSQQKPKSPPTNRILKPNQGQNAPVSGQLNRQGSWYRKAPEDKVKRLDNLKKQHSLG